jgi:hypothetical protein
MTDLTYASTATVDDIPVIWVEPPQARAHASLAL